MHLDIWNKMSDLQAMAAEESVGSEEMVPSGNEHVVSKEKVSQPQEQEWDSS